MHQRTKKYTECPNSLPAYDHDRNWKFEGYRHAAKTGFWRECRLALSVCEWHHVMDFKGSAEWRKPSWVLYSIGLLYFFVKVKGKKVFVWCKFWIRPCRCCLTERHEWFIYLRYWDQRTGLLALYLERIREIAETDEGRGYRAIKRCRPRPHHSRTLDCTVCSVADRTL